MLSNITSINLDLQTQGSALVAKQVNALVSPARRIYVFGTATDAFPYFSTFANALTYANSLTPSTTNPVSIVLLSKSDNTPVTITGNDDWYALCLDGIYVSSPYREIFSTTTLPTTLPKGMRVMYEDANGVESLWVGNADGVAVPSSGYYEYIALGALSASPAIQGTIKNTIPFFDNLTFSRTGTGTYVLNTNQSTFDGTTTCFYSLSSSQVSGSENITQIRARRDKNFGADNYKIVITSLDATGAPLDAISVSFVIHVIVRPA